MVPSNSDFCCSVCSQTLAVPSSLASEHMSEEALRCAQNQKPSPELRVHNQPYGNIKLLILFYWGHHAEYNMQCKRKSPINILLETPYSAVERKLQCNMGHAIKHFNSLPATTSLLGRKEKYLEKTSVYISERTEGWVDYFCFTYSNSSVHNYKGFFVYVCSHFNYFYIGVNSMKIILICIIRSIQL